MALVALGPEQVSTLVFQAGKSQSLALALAQLRTLSYRATLEQEEGSSTAPILPQWLPVVSNSVLQFSFAIFAPIISPSPY